MSEEMARTIDPTESQIEVAGPRALAASNGAVEPPSIETILAAAVERGLPVEALEKLVALKERVDASKARQAFNAAFSAFKSECPPVPRRTPNHQFKTVTADGRSVARMYASLEDIEGTVRGPLGKHGLSYRWGDEKIADGILSIHCIVAHIGGHAESATGAVPIDSKAGCSDQQKFGTAKTYAMRYSMIAALGLTTCDEDTDGNSPSATITENQAADLDALADEVKANKDALCGTFGVKKLSELQVANFKPAIRMLEAKRKKA